MASYISSKFGLWLWFTAACLGGNCDDSLQHLSSNVFPCKTWCTYTLSTSKASVHSFRKPLWSDWGPSNPICLGLTNEIRKGDLFCKQTSSFIYIELVVLQWDHKVLNSGLLLLFSHPSSAALPHTGLSAFRAHLPPTLLLWLWPAKGGYWKSDCYLGFIVFY